MVPSQIYFRCAMMGIPKGLPLASPFPTPSALSCSNTSPFIRSSPILEPFPSVRTIPSSPFYPISLSQNLTRSLSTVSGSKLLTFLEPTSLSPSTLLLYLSPQTPSLISHHFFLRQAHCSFWHLSRPYMLLISSSGSSQKPFFEAARNVHTCAKNGAHFFFFFEAVGESHDTLPTYPNPASCKGGGMMVGTVD